MKLVRYQGSHGPRIGVVRDDQVSELVIEAGPTASMRRFVERVVAGEVALQEVVARTDRDTGLPLADVRLLAPIDDPAKIVAIGLNYADHAAEGQVALPQEPLVFAKFPSAIVGPDAAITWDRALTDAVDYEAELGVVIGATAWRVPPERALEHVFGYSCLDDVSARDLQFGDGQWVRAKSLDTFCPIGPWIVTADEVPDPQALGIRCVVSGETLQEATTADMYFSVAQIISRLSHAFRLEPGDVIATGTPPGVGWFREPRRMLKDGDEVVVEIDGIGRLRNPVVVGGASDR